ncbi:uncharacterized protein LOC135839526 [Planococcus citri]|uniref:uncharacterized protein LOC135839526 n=1 Tax=Planococcus citri TaxID=170843 RepID=UPI0031F93DE8
MELRSCRKTRASTNHYSDHIKLKFNKKMKTSTSSANAKLILHVNATTNKLERFNGTPLEPVPDLGRLKLYQFIHTEWFQDNSLLFDNLLTKREDFILCIYPPGSGKSTTATLLYYYLSKNAKPPGEIQKWLNKCKFQEKEKEKSRENPSYTEFRRSSSFVMLMDFSRIRGDTRERLENVLHRPCNVLLETLWNAN